MPSFSSGSSLHPRLATQVVFTKLDNDDSVLLHLNSKDYYALNETATIICKHLDDGSSMREIVEGLSNRYDVDPQTARQHVGQFLTQLQEQDLIELRATN